MSVVAGKKIRKVKKASGSGSAAMAGYEYQIDVSVWLALELVVVARLTEEMTLEPASEEDLEADVAESQPGRVVNRVPLEGYTLIVQAKRKTTDAWTPTTLKTLLDHGSDTRISAAERLKVAKNRYLLVTSAGLNGDASKLKVRKAGNWPGTASIPSVIKDALTVDATGRLAVISNEDDERLDGDIDRLLIEGCSVPGARLAECKERLRQDARARIRNAGNGKWTRAELEAVIRDHDGYLASSPELDHFIHPLNWSELRVAMKTESAAIIVGQSGTGKTLSTLKLYEELRADMPGLTRVPIRLGPGELRDKLIDQSIPTPVLFDIEDPWGRFDFDPRCRPWNDQLAGFFANADQNRMVVATSRNDVALASGAIGEVKPWIVALESENYGKPQRQQLFRTRIDGLPRDLQALARGSETRVLDRLATPLEIQKFFDALRTQDRAGLKNPHRYVEDAIDSAHQNAIEQTVISQIDERNDVPAAAVVWALLTASDKVTRTLVREIEDGLADSDEAMTKGVSPLIDFLVAARNLRQGDGGTLTYYHPRVQKGVERALTAARIVARRSITKLLDFLVSPDGPDPAWGAGAAARILAEAGEKFGVRPSAGTAALIDGWLAAQVAEGGKAFERNLELASRAGSPASNVGEVARYLLNRQDKSWGFEWWSPSDHPDEWFERHAAEPATKPILEMFIEYSLPTNRLSYPDDFAVQLGKLAQDLTPAFMGAARRAVRLGPLSSDDAIAEGALEDLDGFEAIVDMAAAELTPTAKQREVAAALHLDLTNDVYDDDHAQHLSENEHGYTAHEFLKSYVRRMRRDKGWERLAQHRHAGMLRSYWTRQLAEAAKEKRPGKRELAGAFNAAYGTKDEDDLWLALAAAWDERYLPQLRARLLGGGATERVEQATMACAIERAPDTLHEVVGALVAKGDANRLVELAATLAWIRRGRTLDGSKHVEAADAAAARLPQPFRSIGNAALTTNLNKAPRLSAAGRTALASIATPSDAVRRVRLRLDEHITLATSDDVRWALDEAKEAETAILGVEAAIRRNMSAEVDKALGHRFAHVVAPALTAVASPLAAPLPNNLLDLAGHRASPVRRALAAILAAKPHRGHQRALMTLLTDQWSRHSQHYGQDDNDYPIARTAADALTNQPPPTAATAKRLLTLATDTADPQVRRSVLTLLAKKGDQALQQAIFDLAVQPGRQSVRRGAASALLAAAARLAPSIIAGITASLLATRFEPVAAILALLLGWRGDPSTARDVAGQLATNHKRRVLLLLVVWLLKDRERAVAEEIAAMLPVGHEGVAWALGAVPKPADDSTVADLGEPSICEQVLGYMQIGVAS